MRSVLEQRYPRLEYIVIDGASTDGSVEVIRRYARGLAHWVSEPDGGQTGALIKGFARATGDIRGEPSRAVTNWETGAVMTVRAEHLTLCGNAFVSAGADQHVLAIPGWDFVMNTLTSARNDFWNPGNPASIFFDWTAHFTLADWQRRSGQDSDSVYADPNFTDAQGWNFTPPPGSPWRGCAGTPPSPPKPPGST